jgi:Zn finger protein HypA/HybF involved in hydrogenase expression
MINPKREINNFVCNKCKKTFLYVGKISPFCIYCNSKDVKLIKQTEVITK